MCGCYFHTLFFAFSLIRPDKTAQATWFRTNRKLVRAFTYFIQDISGILF